jgi:hypothetical protein
MRGRIVCLTSVLLFVLAIAPTAHACSCFAGDPRERLEAADGAFIGVLLSRDPPAVVGDSGQTTTYHFRVDERFKGDLGETVDVESASNGAACGFEVQPGQKMGFFIDREGGTWHGGLCGQIDPDDLRKAAKPLPPPDGTGDLAFLLGGGFGEARTLGLDASGKTLQYGYGAGDTLLASVCPGSRFAVEIAQGDGGPPFPSKLAVRDLETFEVVRETALRELPARTVTGRSGEPTEERSLSPRAVSCRSQAGDDAVVFATNVDSGEERTIARIVRVRGSEESVVWEGTGSAAALPADRGSALVGTTTSKLIEVDLASGAVRDLAKIPGVPGLDLALSPDHRRLAALAQNESDDYPDQHAFVADLRTGAVKDVMVRDKRQMVWISNDRLAAVPGGGDSEEVVVFDAALERVTKWTGWNAATTICVNGTLYGAGWGKLTSAPALKGGVKQLRTFDSPEVYELVAVPPRSAEPEAAAAPGAEPTSSPSPAPVATSTPVAFAPPESEPVDDSSPVGPAVALGVSAVALGAGAFLWRRRSI